MPSKTDKQPKSGVSDWVDNTVTYPLKQVSREVFALMVLAGIGVAVGVVTTCMHVANRIKKPS